MTTIREQIMRAVLARLNSPDKPDGVPEAQRVRALASPEVALPLIVVYPLKEEVQRHKPVDKRTFVFRVDCRASAEIDSEESVDAMCDAMLAWATQALTGQRLGGLVHDISESAVDWNIEAADYAYCAATIDFVAEYQTIIADQTRRT